MVLAVTNSHQGAAAVVPVVQIARMRDQRREDVVTSKRLGVLLHAIVIIAFPALEYPQQLDTVVFKRFHAAEHVSRQAVNNVTGEVVNNVTGEVVIQVQQNLTIVRSESGGLPPRLTRAYTGR